MIQVSVIIPTFNRSEKVAKAIQSVLLQTGADYELIVVDDGSEDDTASKIKKKFPAVKYFFQANRGPAAARNIGLKHARGKWIAFLDSDDEWTAGKLKAQLDFFEQNPDYAIAQTEEIWIRSGRRVNPMKKHQKSGGFIFEKCLPLCRVSPSAVMIHKEVFEVAGFFDESLPACEDYDLWLRVAARFPVGLISKPYVIKYGGHSDQLSRRFPAMDRFRIQALIKILKSGVLSPDQENAARKTLEEKSRIYIQGALKRAKEKEIAELREILPTVGAYCNPPARLSADL